MKNKNCIKKYRIEANLTQGQLAKKTKLTLRTMQSYERGERLPDIYTIQRIAKVLGVDVEDLYPPQAEK